MAHLLPANSRQYIPLIVIWLSVTMCLSGSAQAGSYDCYPFCASSSQNSSSSSSSTSSSRSRREEARAEAEAAREHRRMLEAKRRAQMDSERRAERSLRKLQEKLNDETRGDSSSPFGHRYGHGSDDGQAGAHCMYGADGNLIYAPDGAQCSARKGEASPGPAAPNPNLKRGCAAGDCKNGHGTYVWSDGTRYIGGFKNGLHHGQGSLAFASGASYVGGWKLGERTGVGTAIFPDGRVKAGRWSGNKYIGEAEATPARIDFAWPDLSRPAESVGGGENDYAVIVGIEDYAHVASIPGASQNALDWYRYMVKTRGVSSDRVALLLDEDATREEIRFAIEDASSRIGRRGNLWFVFIGHGAPSPDGDDGLLIGFDAQQKARSLRTRSLKRSQVLGLLEKSKADQIHVLLDACFSGKNSSGGQLVAGLQPLVVTSSEPTSDVRTTLMTAAASDQFAGPLPGARRPAFSYLVLGGLRGWADANGDGRVEAGELHRYTSSTMRSTIRGRRQTPTHLGDEGRRLGRSADEEGPDVADLLMTGRSAAKGR